MQIYLYIRLLIMKTGSRFLLFLLLFAAALIDSYAQSYGLGFRSHEAVQDERTGLDLSPGETLCFNNNFELSFDLTLFPARRDYFGYVLRLVAGNNENIDLIYDKNAKENSRFKVVIGEHFSNIAFDIPPSTIFSKWNTLKLSFDYDKKLLKISNGKAVYQTAINLKPGSCFKILFGANEYLDFKTTDVPPMKIRNISIAEEGTKKYYWPLDEYEGSIAREELSAKTAQVIKPLWIKKLHYDWQPLINARVNGPASIAFDARREVLHIVADDSLSSYSVRTARTQTVGYSSGRLNLLRGNQSLVDASGQLINFYIDRQLVNQYNPQAGGWTKSYPKANITDFWLYNKFYSSSDSSLYIVGGYGHFIYKNQFQQYHFPSKTWKNIAVQGADGFTPRYLAALGQTAKGAYILGGYGSSSGQQLLNPRNLYDLSYFDAEKKRIKKIYELKIKGEDFVFANSLVINEAENSYYALKFPKNKYQTSLQLMRGSLSSPEFKLSGSPIPYLFHDVRSYADLFYAPESRQFIAVTLYWGDDNHTRVKVYSLYAPPVDQQADSRALQVSTVWYWLGALVLLVIVCIGMWIWLHKKRLGKQEQAIPQASEPHTTGLPAVEPVPFNKIPESSNAVFLFGDMQVFDRAGLEITRQFTPLIKELFLVMLIYSIRWERGISSEKLKELLWFDKTEDSARNNRSVSIVKLKNILDHMDDCTISKDTGYWKINLGSGSTYVDYSKYMSIIKSKKKMDKASLLELSAIIKRGAFMPNVNYEWMDSFKAEVSNEIIDTFLHYSNGLAVADDPEFLVELANYIFYFDPVNEEAMGIKCKALAHLGKHSQAKNTYENFGREYRLLYGHNFDQSFNDVLNS